VELVGMGNAKQLVLGGEVATVLKTAGMDTIVIMAYVSNKKDLALVLRAKWNAPMITRV